MRITVYVGNGEYVDTINIDDNMTESDISEIATEAAYDWVENNIYWESEED